MPHAPAKPTRVAYVIWSLDLGGAEQVVIRLAAALDRARCAPLIICLNEPGPFAGQAARAGVEVIALHKRGPVDLGALARLARLLRARRIDVVHTHLWGANLWGRIAARLAGVKTVIVTEHNVDTWKRGYHFAIDRLLAPLATGFVAVSQQVREFYEARGVGVGRWQVIYNGVDTSAAFTHHRNGFYQTLGIREDEPVVGLIGRLVPAKAPEIFVQAVVQAAREVPSLKALIVGDGPLRQLVEEQVHRLGLDGRVICTGTRQDVPQLLQGMSALVFSSEREGLSMAMLEAMAAGVPVVATRVGGTPELIESGVSGILVPPQQPHVLADRLVELLRQPEQAQAIGRAARARVEQHFSLHRMVKQHEELYTRLGQATRDKGQEGTRDKRQETRLLSPVPCLLSQTGVPVRVVYVIDNMGRGGAQRQLIELVRRLPRASWEPVVISLSTEPWKSTMVGELTAAGVRVHQINQHGALDVAALWRLTRLLRRYRPAIAHLWLFTATCYGGVAAWLAGVPRVIHAMRSSIDDLTPRQRKASYWFFRHATCVTINADVVRPNLASEGRVPTERVRTIYNGIDLAVSPAAAQGAAHRAAWQVPPQGQVVAMVARFAPPKDHATLIDAAARVVRDAPGTCFVLVGDGPLRSSMEERVRVLGIADHVRFTGERQDVWPLLQEIDLCVLSTRHEGCSNVIMEAMAAGKPVVATNVGGNPELVEDGVTGLLVPPTDAAALAGAITRLLQHPDEAQAMGVRGRARAAQRFSIEAAVQANEALYRELLGAGRA